MINEQRHKIQMEALKALEANKYKGIIILPTGAGKTYVLIEALKRLYKPEMSVLYTCDSVRLRDSDFDKELVKWGAAEFCDIIQKECYQTTRKFTGRHYNILLADEGDFGLTTKYSKLFTENTFDYIIFVSATLEHKKRSLAKSIAPVVYERKLTEIEDSGVINKSEFYYVPYLLNKQENEKYLRFNKRFQELLVQPQNAWRDKRLKFLSFERLHFLASLESSVYICQKLLDELKDRNKKTLIFCGHTEQADKIAISYHAKNADKKHLDLFNSGDIRNLAVVGKIDRGVNIDGVNQVILEYVTRSETKMIQKIGRGKRLQIDDVLRVYFLIPYYTDNMRQQKPTVTMKKIEEACANMGIENAKTYILK